MRVTSKKSQWPNGLEGTLITRPSLLWASSAPSCARSVACSSSFPPPSADGVGAGSFPELCLHPNLALDVSKSSGISMMKAGSLWWSCITLTHQGSLPRHNCQTQFKALPIKPYTAVLYISLGNWCDNGMASWCPVISQKRKEMGGREGDPTPRSWEYSYHI